MKKAFVFLLKMFISAVLAVVILSLWCLVYYNPPISIPQPDNYTNYKYQSTSWWANMTEGYGWGSINNIGYNNHDDYDSSKKTIAFIGSSQVQALQVPQDKNMVSLTQRLLHEDLDSNNDFQCLNLGVSGHFFNINASNYEYFVEHFENVDYVIFEIIGFKYTEEELDKILAGEYHSDMGERGVLYKALQRVPYFRLLTKQFQDLSSADTTTETTDTIVNTGNRYEKVEAIIKKLARLSSENGIKLIFLYHQEFAVSPDNTITFNTDLEMEQYLMQICEENNIPVINMNEPMAEHYKSSGEFSYGFSNVTFGAGHLNTVGHALIAQSVYNEIVRQVENS